MTYFLRKNIGIYATLIILMNIITINAFPNHVDPEIISKGEFILNNMTLEIREYFKKRPQDTALNIYQSPINKILKVDHNGTQYYAVYDYELGKGTYSRVLLGKNIDTHTWVAIKEKYYSISNDLKHEINQLSIMNNYLGYTVYNDRIKKNHYLFMNLENGLPIEKLYTRDEPYNLNDIFNIIIAGFYGLEKLHKKNIVHNDIHEGNLIYDTKRKTASWVDIAFSIKLNATDQFMYLDEPNPNIPYCYNAPESNTMRGYMTDIYQLGFTSLRMLLILSENNADIKKKHINSRAYSCEVIKLKKDFLLSNASSELMKNRIHLLYKMIDPDSMKRPTLTEAIRKFNSNTLIRPAQYNQPSFEY